MIEITPAYDAFLKRKVTNIAKYSPTKPPYTVEIFNSKVPSFYISGEACNICVGVFFDRDLAEKVAKRCNEIVNSSTKGE